MDEKIFTGYCRCLDQIRIVTVETEDGFEPTVDCGYGSCAFQSGCQLARNITDFLKSLSD